MWIYVPGQTGSRSSPESADSISPSDWRVRMLERSATWRGRHSQCRVWSQRCKREPWMALLCGRMPRPSTARRGLALWMESLRASRVNPSLLPEKEKPKTTNAGCGEKSPASFAKHEHGSSFLRTCRGSYLPGLEPPSETYSDRWPAWGSMRSGVCYRQAPWVPPTSECGGSASEPGWQTPLAASGIGSEYTYSNGDHTRPFVSLIGQAMQAQWGTPRASDGEKGGPGQSFGAGGVPLAAQVAKEDWATPTARDYKDRSNPSENVPTNCLLGRQAPRTNVLGEQSSTNTPGSPRRLNPIFVAWLMGYPFLWVHPEWINFGPSATQWFRSRRLLLSAYCGDDCSAD